MEKQLVIALFGPLGAGKKGVRDALENQFSLIGIEMSGVFREKRTRDSDFARRYPKVVGKNYPLEAVLEAFNAKIDIYSGNVGFVIDGAPRGTPKQVNMLLDKFHPSAYHLLFVHLLCSRYTCGERVRGRREASVNESLFEREDDQQDIVRERLDEHFNDIQDILRAINANNGTLIEVDAEKPQEEVIIDVFTKVTWARLQSYSPIR